MSTRATGEVVKRDDVALASALRAESRTFQRSGDPVEQFGGAVGIGIGFVQRGAEQRAGQLVALDRGADGEALQLGGSSGVQGDG